MIREVVTAKEDMSIKSAIKTLHEKHIGSLVITNGNGRCKGIFTERDAIRIIAGDISLDQPLEKVMTKNPITIREWATFSEAITMIVTHGVRHLPVVDADKKLVGIMSIRNFLDEVVGISRI